MNVDARAARIEVAAQTAGLHKREPCPLARTIVHTQRRRSAVVCTQKDANGGFAAAATFGRPPARFAIEVVRRFAGNRASTKTLWHRGRSVSDATTAPAAAAAGAG